MRRLFTLLLCLVLSPALAASLLEQRPSPVLGAALDNSQEFLPVRQAFRLEVDAIEADQVRLRFDNAPGYYLYRHAFRFTTDPASFQPAQVELPDGLVKHDEYFGEVEVYYDQLEIKVPLDNPGQQPLYLDVTFQGCADRGLCYPPETQRLPIHQPPPSAQSPPLDGWKLLLLFLSGLGLTFTPCVLPMLPILSSILLQDKRKGLRALPVALAYVLPMALCFAMLGALMGLFGASLNLQARLQSAWVLIPFAAFFSVFALAMFGLFELRLPGFLREPLERLSSNGKRGPYWNAALLGVLSSLLVSPCVSAPLAGVLLYISSTGDALGGGLGLFSLGMGMGTPLLVFAVGGGALLPRSGPWMTAVRNLFGVLLLAVALWLLERVLPAVVSVFLWGTLAAGCALFLGTLELTSKSPRQKLAQLLGLILLAYALAAWFGALKGADDPLKPLATIQPPSGQQAVASAAQGWQTLTSAEQLLAAQQAAKASGTPLLLDWYADWCISCKVIERQVLRSDQVEPYLSSFSLVRFDITASNAEQRALLDRYGLFGPPAIQLFDAKGEEWNDLRVVGEIDSNDFSQRLQQALSR